MHRKLPFVKSVVNFHAFYPNMSNMRIELIQFIQNYLEIISFVQGSLYKLYFLLSTTGTFFLFKKNFLCYFSEQPAYIVSDLKSKEIIIKRLSKENLFIL